MLSMNTAMVREALRFATKAHAGQTRKYTGEPYIVHPIAVAHEVEKVLPGDEKAVTAAILHDTVEDTDVTHEDILKTFGEDVAGLVFELTDPKLEANRAKRKEASRNFLRTVSDRAKTIKLADLKNNTHSIVVHDPNFAKVYMAEKRDLLPCLIGGDERLWKECKFMVDSYFHLTGN